MKVATWNVNSIRTRQQHVIDWLNVNPVDVLCLQETKVIDEDFPRTPFEELGYYLYISGQKAYNGVAIFSRVPMTDISVGFTPILGEAVGKGFDEQKRVITGVVKGIRIVNLYVPNGASVGSDKYDYKLLWLSILKVYLKTLLEMTRTYGTLSSTEGTSATKCPSEVDEETSSTVSSSQELCVCGDFNIALEDRDIYDPIGKDNCIMASLAEREALKTVLEIGLKDAFRKFTSEGGHFSWWDYRTRNFQRDRGWRIDHHYLTRKLYEKALSCKIDIEPRKREQPSDHTPVLVEF